MKIATTTGDFSRYCKTDVERVRELHRAGFRYVDLSMYAFTPDCAYMGENWREEAQKLKDLAQELGVVFVQAHSQGGNPLSDDAAHVEFWRKATLRSIEICAFLGIDRTVVHAGWHGGLTEREWFEKNKAAYETLLPTAQRLGVHILCENSTACNMGDMYYINKGKQMREFIEFVAHPNFHGCWDTGHANCEGAQYDEILALGKELYAIHYNDNRGTADEHLVPYMGTLNHDEVMCALTDVGFDWYFTLECDGVFPRVGGWPVARRAFSGKARAAEATIDVRRCAEKLMMQTAREILSAYGCLEE